MTDSAPLIPRFRDALSSGFVVTVGIGTAGGKGFSPILGEAAALRGKAAAVALPERLVSGGGMTPAALACLVREGAGVDVMLPVSLQGGGTAGLMGELAGARALGVENLVAADGLPSPGEGFGRASKGDFFLGALSAPPYAGAEGETASPRSLVERGAHFAVTGPVFHRPAVEGFLEEAAGAGLPVVVGLLPILSHGMLRALETAFPGPAVPPAIRERLGKSPAQGVRREGILVCRELIEEFRGVAAGVHLMPSGDPFAAREVLQDGGSAAVEKAVAEAAAGPRISCRSAFRVAEEQGVPVEEVGRVVQRRKVKIVSCQLGCFR